MKVLIVGLHKADILKNLYANATFLGPRWRFMPSMPALSHNKHHASIEIAQQLIQEQLSKNNRLYFDYVDLGDGPIPLKIDLSGHDIDPTQYDAMHGQDRAKEVILGMRQTMVAMSEQKSGFEGFLGFLNQAMLEQGSKNFFEDDSETLKKEPAKKNTR
ncbi:MAG: hypothetical protein RLZ35_742 [Pseudomonadota bacterium]|jgi:hypothetical protein